MIKKLILAATIAACSISASAKTIIIDGTEVEIGDIIANGSGCPPGSVNATASEDNKQVTILFSQYRAQTNSTDLVAISDCNIAIPLSVPVGYTVGIVEIDWRGTTYTTPDALVNFHREFFFSGSKEDPIETNWEGEGLKNFVLSDNPRFIHYSECDGEPLIARADTSATVIGPNSVFSLRSADVQSRLLFNININEC